VTTKECFVQLKYEIVMIHVIIMQTKSTLHTCLSFVIKVDF